MLYGGAAGGGKSHLKRVAAIVWALEVPGLQIYLFRRTYPELLKNHMEGPSGFPVLLKELIETGWARINWSDLVISFKSGSKIFLCHCQYPKDVYKYQGAEMHVLMIDELTHWPREMYAFLRSRVRMAGLTVPEKYEGLFPRILNGSNPGGIGHNWVKAAWIDPQPALSVWRAAREDGGMLRQYIPARLADNPSIHDPEQYKAQLAGLGNPALVRAMEDGDWNIVAGGMFDDLWRPEVHVVEPFEIPRSWRIDRSLDWGSSKPFSAGWWAESDGTEATLRDGSRRSWSRGTLFQIMEHYGWNGQPNEGCRKLASEVAREVVAMEKEMPWGSRVRPGPADNAIFDETDGVCIARDFSRHGVTWTRSEKSPGSRKVGAEKIRGRLKASLKGPIEEPGLFVFQGCRHSIRTIPTLPRDDRDQDDVNSDAEDHAYDMWRYRIVSGGASAGSSSLPWG